MRSCKENNSKHAKDKRRGFIDFLALNNYNDKKEAEIMPYGISKRDSMCRN